MADSGAIRAGRAFVELFTKDSTKAGLESARRKLFYFGRQLRRMGREIMMVGAIGMAPGLLAVREFANTGEQLSLMAAQTRTSVEELSALSYAAESVGGNLATVGDALHGMNTLLLQAHDNSQGAVETLRMLNLEFAALENMPAEQRLRTFAEALSKVESPTRRAALAQQVFGGAASKLLPIINQGAAGFDNFMHAAEEADLVMSGQDAAAGAALTVSFRDLRSILARIAAVVGAELSPVVSVFVAVVKSALGPIKDWVADNGSLVRGLMVAAVFIVGLGTSLYVLSHVAMLASFAFAALSFVVGAFGTVLSLVTSPMTLLVVGLAAAAAAAIYFTGSIGPIKASLSAIGATFSEVWGGINDALSAGNLGLAAKIAFAGLKLAWIEGVGWLETRWLSFKNFLLDNWDIASSGLAMGFTASLAGIQAIWVGFAFVVETIWAGMWNRIRDVSREALAQVMGAFAYAKSLVTDFAGGTAAAGLARSAAMEEGRGLFGASTDIGEIQTRRARELQGIIDDTARQMAAIEGEMIGAIGARARAMQERLSELREAAIQARQQLAQLTGEAAVVAAKAAARAAAQAGATAGVDTFAGGKFMAQVSGTFSAAQVMASAGGKGPQERTARATERAAEVLPQILNAVRNPLLFGA